MKLRAFIVFIIVLLLTPALCQEEYVKVYSIQIWSYRSEDDAVKCAQEAEQGGLAPVMIRHKDNWYKVRVMTFLDYEAANKKRDELRAAGKYKDCIVVREKVPKSQVQGQLPQSRYQVIKAEIELNPPSAPVEELAAEAANEMSERDFTEAMPLLVEIVTHYPDSPQVVRAKIDLAKCLVQSALEDTTFLKRIPYTQKRLDHEAAMQLCAEAISTSQVELEKQEAQYWLARARHRLALYDNIKDLTKAVEEYRKVINNYAIPDYKARAQKEIMATTMEMYSNGLASIEQVLQEAEIMETQYQVPQSLAEILEVKLLKAEVLLIAGKSEEYNIETQEIHELLNQFVTTPPDVDSNPRLLQAKVNVFFPYFDATLPVKGSPDFDELLFMLVKLINHGLATNDVRALRRNFIYLFDLFYQSDSISEAKQYLDPVIEALDSKDPELSYKLYNRYLSYLLFRKLPEEAVQAAKLRYSQLRPELKNRFVKEMDELFFCYGIKAEFAEEG